MRSSIIGTLMLIFISSSVAFGLGSVVKKLYRQFTYPVRWEEAQRFCRREFTDLAIINSWSDLNHVYIKNYYAWIGLHRDDGHGSNWVWSDGQNYYLDNWQENMENAIGKCAMVKRSDKKIYVEDCGSRRFFICRKYHTYDYESVFIPEAKTWPEAQDYCRTHYANLASFPSSYSYSIVTDIEFPMWIGLHRDGAAWSWSLGDSKYRNWFTGEPSNSGDCGSIYSISRSMASQNCGTRLPFLCILDNMVLVKENKNWEEALEHCRGLRSSTNDVRYDLLSLQPEDQQDLIMNKVMQADSEEVWTGLRFLAGEWLWVNGADMLHTNLPLCPAPRQHCGILSKNSAGGMEARDCSERKNFICYSYTT